MSPNSALFRLFTQSDGQCRAICEDTPDCRWVNGQQHIMCSDQAKGHCCTPDHINTKRHFFWTFFYRFYYWYPIDYSPSPLYCYLFRRSVLTNIKVSHNIPLCAQCHKHLKREEIQALTEITTPELSSLPVSLDKAKQTYFQCEIAE